VEQAERIIIVDAAGDCPGTFRYAEQQQKNVFRISELCATAGAKGDGGWKVCHRFAALQGDRRVTFGLRNV
jgi:hypothetical protein